MLKQGKKKGKTSFASKERDNWTVEDVTDWLASIELGELSGRFREQAISGSALSSLTDSDLLAMGISKIGHRKKILLEVNPSAAATTSTGAGTDSESRGHGSLLTSSSESGVVSIKVQYGSDLRKIRLPLGCRLAELRTEISTKMNVKSFKLSYEDSAGDKLALASEEDWEEFLAEGHKGKVHVRSSSSSKKSSSSSSSSSRSSKSVSHTAVFSVFDSLLQSTIVIDQKGFVQYLNPAAAKITGYSSAEMLGHNITMLMPEEFARDHDRYLAMYMKTGKAKIIGTGRNVTMLTKDGQYVPIFLQVTEHKSTGKTYFVGTITEAQAERKPQTVLMQVREVLDTLANPALAITQAGHIQVFNKAAQELFGYSLMEVVGKNVNMLMPDEFARNHDQYMNNYLTTGQAKIIGIGRDVMALTKTGEFVPVHLSISERKDGTQSIFTGVLTRK